MIAAGLALHTAPAEILAQDASRVAPPAAKAIKFSDLDPQTAAELKAEHYSVLGQNIQQTYHQQLNENRQRTAMSVQQSAAPATPITEFPRSTPPVAAGYQSPQTFLPPVHITPPQQRYIPGNRIGVRNFASHANPTGTANSSAYHRSSAAPHSSVRHNQPSIAAQRVQQRRTQTADSNSHVFLQDRIANALTRRFKRDQPKADTVPARTALRTPSAMPADVDPPTPALEVAHSVIEFEPETVSPHQRSNDFDTVEAMARNFKRRQSEVKSDITFGNHSPTPVQTSVNDVSEPVVAQFEDRYSYSEILQSNQYAAKISGTEIADDRPDDHPIENAVTSSINRSPARQRSIQRARSIGQAVHHDSRDTSLDVLRDDQEATIFRRYAQIRQTSGEHHHHDGPFSAPVIGRRTKLKKPIQSPQIATMPRPDKYGRVGRKTSGSNVSVLLQESGGDFSPTPDENEFRPEEDFKTDRRRDRNTAPRELPNRRDDLQDADDARSDLTNRRQRDRVRSRLNEDLDLEDLDDDLDQELDDDDLGEDDDGRPVRLPGKTCRQYQQELIAGSIRDISLDISPPAASEGAQYGGLARTWTDRRGNVLATGALVDLRRGYVILDSGQKLAYARLSESDLAAISEFWRLPEVCVIGNYGGSPYRSWTPQVVTWKASNLCHKPLFFENIQLERYGHSRGPIAQPIHSTLHFFTSLVAVPYNSAISPPNECEYALGFYRPGDCAPWLKDPIPISLAAIRREALFVTGAAFIP